jgi:hypoxanthine phosphoribosyltransferase
MAGDTSKLIKDVQKKALPIFSKADVEAALDKLAVELHERVGEKDPIFLCVLLGGIVPLGNLLPRLDFPLEINYVHATRYMGKTQGEEIVWKAKPSVSLKDRTVVVVDDILDGGVTLKAIVDYCYAEGAKEVLTAVLIDKRKEREEGCIKEADFRGLVVGNAFVVGFGLDYQEYLRNLPGIFAVAEEHQ